MDQNVLISAAGGVGRITLNRAAALHALTLPMCEAILAALKAWRSDASVHLVMIDHADGTRGFCAGGDIRMLAESGAGDGAKARAFFAAEYRMNVEIARFPKPVLALMDGVTMGGGVGLSVHGSHQVATERTVFAMPETGIGLFPDVGGGWFLPRLRGHLGTWLALTGARLKGGDVAAAHIASHFLPSELLPNLKKQVLEADFSGGAAEMLGEILSRASHPVPPGAFEPHLETIEETFSAPTAEEIAAALAAHPSPWAQVQYSQLAAKSPETVKVALRQLQIGAALERFEDNMAMEYRIGWRKVQSADFLEGVRAVILDKDNSPKWSPETLEAVSQAQVEAYFAPLGDDELAFED
ncbi:MAG: enoyl-CoA hydratase/isomerase family protein [Pseudomonadota bacterium]